MLYRRLASKLTCFCGEAFVDPWECSAAWPADAAAKKPPPSQWTWGPAGSGHQQQKGGKTGIRANADAMRSYQIARDSGEEHKLQAAFSFWPELKEHHEKLLAERSQGTTWGKVTSPQTSPAPEPH